MFNAESTSRNPDSATPTVCASFSPMDCPRQGLGSLLAGAKIASRRALLAKKTGVAKKWRLGVNATSRPRVFPVPSTVFAFIGQWVENHRAFDQLLDRIEIDYSTVADISRFSDCLGVPTREALL